MEEFHPDERLQDMWKKVLGIVGFTSYFFIIVVLIIIKAVDPELQVFPTLVLLTVIEASIVVFVMAWIPYYFGNMKYIISDDFVRIQKGAIWKRFITIPFEKVQNVEISQGPIERGYSLGKVLVHTAGYSGQSKADGVIKGIKDFQKLASVLAEKVKRKTGANFFEKVNYSKSDELLILNSIRLELIEIKKLMSKEKNDFIDLDND